MLVNVRSFTNERVNEHIFGKKKQGSDLLVTFGQSFDIRNMVIFCNWLTLTWCNPKLGTVNSWRDRLFQEEIVFLQSQLLLWTKPERKKGQNNWNKSVWVRECWRVRGRGGWRQTCKTPLVLYFLLFSVMTETHINTRRSLRAALSVWGNRTPFTFHQSRLLFKTISRFNYDLQYMINYRLIMPIHNCNACINH